MRLASARSWWGCISDIDLHSCERVYMHGSVAATDRSWRNGMETVMPDTGVVPPETFRMLSGLDLLRGMMEGRYPAAPITATLGFRLVEVAEGRAGFEGPLAFANDKDRKSVGEGKGVSVRFGDVGARS